jgi:hypothetical protein
LSDQLSWPRYYDSPILSDIKIKYNGITISAHRIVLASQSGWFSRALEGGFREAAVDSLELCEDEPEAISDMLQYMYGRVPWNNSDKDHKATSEELLRLVQIYAVADKCVVSDLSNAVNEHFRTVASSSWIEIWLEKTLKPVINAVYATNPSPSSILRMTVSELTCTYIKSFNGEDTASCFRKLLEDIPEFAADIALRLASEQQKAKSSTYNLTENPKKTFLHWAAQAGDDTSVRQLLAEGVPVDVRDENDETPLHFSTWHGRFRATRTLVEAGADVNASSRAYDSTPLQWAVSQGHGSIASYLRSHGALMPQTIVPPAAPPSPPAAVAINP